MPKSDEELEDDEETEEEEQTSPPKATEKDLERARKLRSENRNLRKRLEEAQGKLEEHEDRDKPELERLAVKAQEAERKAQEAELRANRLTVALDKGLTVRQAARLVGDTLEELEEDAEDLLETIGGGPGGQKDDDEEEELEDEEEAPKGRHRPRELRPGNGRKPEPEETDPAKLAALIPR